MLTLYHFPLAPNPARVLTYLKEKQISGVRLETVDFFKNEQNSEAHLARSPRGVVPVLELDDGRFLTETLPIVEYLEERFPEPNMIGATPEERAFTRSAERDIELGILIRTINLVHFTKSPLGLPPNPEMAARELERLPAALARIDNMIGEGEYVLGDSPTIADCTLLAALNFSRFADLQIEQPYSNMSRWYESYRQHQQSLPEIA